MSERKVLNKYYPPDYDGAAVPRIKNKKKQLDVRTMIPFNMRCSTCENYISCGTKFNVKREVVQGETYKNLRIDRFYFKCPRCMATIVYRTNLEEKGYEIEQGATENFRALKLAEQREREQAEAEEEEEKIDPMKQLERRTKASKQQMEASEQIQSLRLTKHQFHGLDIDSVIESKRQEAAQESMVAIAAPNQDDEIRAEAKRLLKMRAPESKLSLTAHSSSPPRNLKSTTKTSSSALAKLKKKFKSK